MGKPTEQIVKLDNVRLAFADNLWTPGVFTPKGGKPTGKPAYDCKLILERGSENQKRIEVAMKTIAKERWGEHAAAHYKALAAQNNLALHDGDHKPTWEGFPGHMYVTARRPGDKGRPRYLNRDRSVFEAEEELRQYLYSGAWVNASVGLYLQDGTHGRTGINCSLRGLQFASHGDRFGGGAIASVDEFDELEPAAIDNAFDDVDNDNDWGAELGLDDDAAF